MGCTNNSWDIPGGLSLDEWRSLSCSNITPPYVHLCGCTVCVILIPLHSALEPSHDTDSCRPSIGIRLIHRDHSHRIIITLLASEILIQSQEVCRFYSKYRQISFFFSHPGWNLNSTVLVSLFTLLCPLVALVSNFFSLFLSSWKKKL